MAFAENFEDLKIWQDARSSLLEIYQIFANCRDYAFRDQIQRAAVSVMNNIAEGFERRTRKDFAHFLDLAKGSAGEVRSMLYPAEDLSYASTDAASHLRERYRGLARSIGALASKLRKTERREPPGGSRQ